MLTKTVTGAARATEVTANIYDELRPSYFNLGKLTTARRDVVTQTISGNTFPLVAVNRNLQLVEAAKGMRIRGPIAQQLTNLPDDKTVETSLDE